MSFLLILTAGLMGWTVSAGAGTQPTTRTSGDPVVDRILDDLEQRGDGIRSLTSKLRADFLDVVAEDEQSKLGSIWFRRDEPNPKFKVVYDKSIFDDVVSNDRHEYLFDGHWLYEKHVKSKTYQENEVVAPGEKVEVFRIGKGPFPLPFGQKKAEILEHFTVTRIRRSPKDPPGTDHLKLIPIKAGEMADKYVEIHFYIDRGKKLPTRIVAHQRRPGSKEVDEIVTVTFTGLEINPGVPDSVLMIEKPKGKEWHVSRKRLDEK